MGKKERHGRALECPAQYSYVKLLPLLQPPLVKDTSKVCPLERTSKDGTR